MDISRTDGDLEWLPPRPARAGFVFMQSIDRKSARGKTYEACHSFRVLLWLRLVRLGALRIARLANTLHFPGANDLWMSWLVHLSLNGALGSTGAFRTLADAPETNVQDEYGRR